MARGYSGRGAQMGGFGSLFAGFMEGYNGVSQIFDDIETDKMQKEIYEGIKKQQAAYDKYMEDYKTNIAKPITAAVTGATPAPVTPVTREALPASPAPPAPKTETPATTPPPTPPPEVKPLITQDAVPIKYPAPLPPDMYPPRPPTTVQSMRNMIRPYVPQSLGGTATFYPNIPPPPQGNETVFTLPKGIWETTEAIGRGAYDLGAGALDRYSRSWLGADSSGAAGEQPVYPSATGGFSPQAPARQILPNPVTAPRPVIVYDPQGNPVALPNTIVPNGMTLMPGETGRR